MSKIKILKSDAVGTLIEKAFLAADTAGTAVHAAAIQCVLHIRDYGDVGLLERLVDGMEKKSMNMRGLRFWVGTFFPVTVRAGKWGLLDPTGDAYKHFILRAMEAYGQEFEPDVAGKDRLFFIDAADANPFWTLSDVQKDNGRNITRITTATLMGQVIGLDGRLDKAITGGSFSGDKELAESFISHMEDAAADWKKANKDKLRIEAANLADQKKLDKGNDNVADAAQPAPSTVGSEPETPDVGGDVTKDETKVEAPTQQVVNG